MTKYSTEELLLYIYGETTENQSREIERTIQTDWIIREKYQALKESINGLDTTVRSPRQQTINAIMDYAKATAEVVP